ncbi:MAG TPA: PEP-CTERM sorting domain-containing protein [Terriglobales bacterium]|nr:PEP-CTERM sorting domain-containing protein [Terriglobales bacterium]
MKNIARLTIIILSLACGTAYAGSFTLGNLPHSPAAAIPVSFGKPFLAPLPYHPAAPSQLKDGYIGTIHLDDTVILSITNGGGPTEVAVPEPTSMLLLGSGLLVAAWRRRRTA